MPTFASSEALVFTEQQGFLRPWWWLVGLLAVFLAGTAVATSMPALLLAPVLLACLFTWLRLNVRFDAQGITYRMRPLSWKRLAWTEVRRAYVREYSPIGEYGGWGIKGSFRNYALNVSGNQCLQLELADGRRILLGTRRPGELRQMLEKLRIGQPAS